MGGPDLPVNIEYRSLQDIDPNRFSAFTPGADQQLAQDLSLPVAALKKTENLLIESHSGLRWWIRFVFKSL